MQTTVYFIDGIRKGITEVFPGILPTILTMEAMIHFRGVQIETLTYYECYTISDSIYQPSNVYSFYSIESNKQKREEIVGKALINSCFVSKELVGEENYLKDVFCHNAVNRKMPVENFVKALIAENNNLKNILLQKQQNSDQPIYIQPPFRPENF